MTKEKNQKYIIEAILHTSATSIPEETLQDYIDDDISIRDVLLELSEDYSGRGIELIKAAGGWSLRTRAEASDIASSILEPSYRLTKAANETLAVIYAYQPITRAEIERVRGVQLSPGIMTQLLQASLIKPGARRDTPGRPLTWNTTIEFLEEYDLYGENELISTKKMKEAGILELPQITSLDAEIE